MSVVPSGVFEWWTDVGLAPSEAGKLYHREHIRQRENYPRRTSGENFEVIIGGGYHEVIVTDHMFGLNPIAIGQIDNRSRRKRLRIRGR